jgi:hypothetical protein
MFGSALTSYIAVGLYFVTSAMAAPEPHVSASLEGALVKKGSAIQLVYDSENTQSLGYKVYYEDGFKEKAKVVQETKFAEDSFLMPNIDSITAVPVEALPAGEYRLVVTACNRDKVCKNSEPLKFSIR